MSKSIGRIFGTGSMGPYGYETDYMQYLRGYNQDANYNMPGYYNVGRLNKTLYQED